MNLKIENKLCKIIHKSYINMYNHICIYKCSVHNICTCVSISKKIQPYVISCTCVASATYPMTEHECYAVKVINGDDINFVAH